MRTVFFILFIANFGFGQQASKKLQYQCNPLNPSNTVYNSNVNIKINEILGVIGLKNNFITAVCDDNINNAEATMMGSVRVLFISKSFVDLQNYSWEDIGILSHEIGHHLNYHLWEKSSTYQDSHKIELEADYFAGRVINLLGGSLDNALEMTKSFKEYDDAFSTHPTKSKRVQAIKNGYLNKSNVFNSKSRNELSQWEIISESISDFYYTHYLNHMTIKNGIGINYTCGNHDDYLKELNKLYQISKDFVLSKSDNLSNQTLEELNNKAYLTSYLSIFRYHMIDYLNTNNLLTNNERLSFGVEIQDFNNDLALLKSNNPELNPVTIEALLMGALTISNLYLYLVDKGNLSVSNNIITIDVALSYLNANIRYISKNPSKYSDEFRLTYQKLGSLFHRKFNLTDDWLYMIRSCDSYNIACQLNDNYSCNELSRIDFVCNKANSVRNSRSNKVLVKKRSTSTIYSEEDFTANDLAFSLVLPLNIKIEKYFLEDRDISARIGMGLSLNPSVEGFFIGIDGKKIFNNPRSFKYKPYALISYRFTITNDEPIYDPRSGEVIQKKLNSNYIGIGPGMEFNFKPRFGMFTELTIGFDSYTSNKLNGHLSLGFTWKFNSKNISLFNKQ